MSTRTEATIEDLYHVDEDGKAEIVNGELVLMSPTGDLHGSAALEIVVRLHKYGKRTKRGRAYGDNVGFIVNLPNRRSFSPDAAFYIGPRTGSKFLEGAPVFAVEIRSEGDYGPAAEQRIADKRRDYFAAGTLCVWDVDLLSPDRIKSYHAGDPEKAIIYRSGDVAIAGNAVPDWSMEVDELLPDESCRANLEPESSK